AVDAAPPPEREPAVEPPPSEPAAEAEFAEAAHQPEPSAAEPAEASPPRPKRSGWWQRARASIVGE
ncbi:MAG TPA: hypothetical protein VKV96_10845, partial [Roseiarcus sp.]|nr:hypothetical protein [Roseiarcus sp.]